MIPEKLEERILLASASPRRHHLMREAGYAFEVIALDVDESFDSSLRGAGITEHLARKKADEFGSIPADTILIAADTMVFLNKEPLGKPKDRDEALRMLRALSGNAHEVITGVCIRKGEKEELFHSLSQVHLRELPEEELVHYVDRYEPYDKAGAYGIQEWIGHIGIERIEGSFFNIMGLPIDEVHRRIQKMVEES